MRRVMLLDRLVERRDFLRHQRYQSFNWQADAVESWVILILEIAFALQTHVNFSVYRHELCTHVSKLSVMDFEFLKREKLVLHFLILKLHEIIRIRNDKKYYFHDFLIYIDITVLIW